MSELTVCFWGTRGSIPTPGRRTEKYGGNTTCLELRHGDTIVVIDAGSGIRRLSEAWAKEFQGRPIEATLLFTHAHWDHIQGFPFFQAAYQKGNRFTIYGNEQPGVGLRNLLSGQMGGAYFPIPIDAMTAEMAFHVTKPELQIGQIRVLTQPLPHPGGCLGYRLEVDGAVFVLATDCELDQVALNRDAIRADHSAVRQYDPKFLSFFQKVDTLVIDCQYTDEDYRNRIGWGHNSLTTVVDFCKQVRPRMVVLFHHDPQSQDSKVDELRDDISEELRESRVPTLVAAAREMLKLRVGRQPRVGTTPLRT